MGKLKEIVLKYKNIIAVLLTIFVAIGINVTFDNDLNALKLNSSIYNVLYILYIIFIIYLERRTEYGFVKAHIGF